MPKGRGSRIRRRLAEVTRTTITSYFTEEEKREISAAAAMEGVTMSSFMAAAALEKARTINTPRKPPSYRK